MLRLAAMPLAQNSQITIDYNFPENQKTWKNLKIVTGVATALHFSWDPCFSLLPHYNEICAEAWLRQVFLVAHYSKTKYLGETAKVNYSSAPKHLRETSLPEQQRILVLQDLMGQRPEPSKIKITLRCYSINNILDRCFGTSSVEGTGAWALYWG